MNKGVGRATTPIPPGDQEAVYATVAFVNPERGITDQLTLMEEQIIVAARVSKPKR
jgi:hypothetical protein